MKRTLFAVGVALLSAVGCGGGGGGGSPGRTYTLAAAEPLDVPPGMCKLAWGPEQVGTGTMFYAVDDPAGTDDIESIIIADSFYLSYACYFDASTQALTDDRFTGSHQSPGQVIADSYDFIVICHNATTDCQFNLTWTATY